MPNQDPDVVELRQAVINAESALAKTLSEGGLGTTCPTCKAAARSEVKAVYDYLHLLVQRVRLHSPTLRREEIPGAQANIRLH